jgi:hypothetical protein
MCNGRDLLNDIYASAVDLYALKVAPFIFGEENLADFLITDDCLPISNSDR